MAPLFAPGVLFNTIKSGVAVDYPIITGSLEVATRGSSSTYPYHPASSSFLINNSFFDKRIPFEALVNPQRHLVGYNHRLNEPHPSGNFSFSANWDGEGDNLYSLMMNNFLAETPEFFLPNGEFTSVVSKKQKDITLTSGSVYGMRIKMRRSMQAAKTMVHHTGAAGKPYLPPQDIISDPINRETFTMYSRPSSFGPPSLGLTLFSHVGSTDGKTVFHFDDSSEGFNQNFGTGPFINQTSITKDSYHGYNFPFTPPYYHGEAWCDIVVTASSENMSISEIQEAAKYTFKRFDSSFYKASSSSGITGIDFVSGGQGGPQSLGRIDTNAVQLSSSLNIKGLGRTKTDIANLSEQELVVDSALDEQNRWIIQTKFETPMLNFSHITSSSTIEDLERFISIPTYGSGSVPRGIWHQHGRIPEENEGVFLEVGPIERNYWTQARGETVELEDLSEALGFAGTPTKIGGLRSSKTVYEAVVAVPFIEFNGRKKFFLLDADIVKSYKKGGSSREALTTGDPQDQIGRSVLDQLQKMEKYIFPPSFDFLNNDIEEVEPIAMYIFEFSHTFNQQDLSDIWQNLPPDIGTEMEESEIAITHPLLKKELLGEGRGNILIDIPNKLRWMVFKVKQRAASNYFKKTVFRNPDINTTVGSSNVTVDEFGETTSIQFNWPYDFFSLVELAKIDSEMEFGNFDEEAIANYTNSIPPYKAVQADLDKIDFVVGGLEDQIIPDNPSPEEYSEESIDEEPEQTPPQEEPPEPTVEGIYDSPNFIPSAVSRNYITAKARFTVELEKSPTLTYNQVVGILRDVIAPDMNIISGYPMEGRSGVVYIAFDEWAKAWYAENSVEALGLGGGGNISEKTQFINKVTLYLRKEFLTEEAKFFVGKEKAALRAVNATRSKYKNNSLYDAEVDRKVESHATSLKNSTDNTLDRMREELGL